MERRGGEGRISSLFFGMFELVNIMSACSFAQCARRGLNKPGVPASALVAVCAGIAALAPPPAPPAAAAGGRGGRSSSSSGGSLSTWRDYMFVNYMVVQAPHSGGERLYGTHFNPSDRIGVLLNMDEGTLTFTKDCVEFDIVSGGGEWVVPSESHHP